MAKMTSVARPRENSTELTSRSAGLSELAAPNSRPIISAIFLSAATILGGCSMPSHRSNDQADAEKGTSLADAQFSIEPGVGVGPVKLGMTAAQVKEVFGEPFRVTGNAYEYQNHGLAVILDNKNCVSMIFCGAWCESSDVLLDVFKGRTSKGIGLRSTPDELRRAYGEPQSTLDIAEKFVVWRYPLIDFAFRNDSLVHITLRKDAVRTKPDSKQ